MIKFLHCMIFFNSKITTEYLINDIDKKKICDKAFIDGTYDEAVKKSTLKRTLNMAINKLLQENTKLDTASSPSNFKNILFDFNLIFRIIILDFLTNNHQS